MCSPTDPWVTAAAETYELRQASTGEPIAPLPPRGFLFILFSKAVNPPISKFEICVRLCNQVWAVVCLNTTIDCMRFHLHWLACSQIADECGGSNFEPYEATMEYNGNEQGDVTDTRLQMDMYICAPFGEYELEVRVRSTNGGSAMERVAWEIEYGPDEVRRAHHVHSIVYIS